MRTRKRPNAPELDFEGAGAQAVAGQPATAQPSRHEAGLPDLPARRVVVERPATFPPVGIEGSIGGSVPRPEQNLVVELAPGYVVERVDDQNWEAKVLKRIAPGTHHKAKHAARWEGVGFFSSPGVAFRRLVQLAATESPGSLTLPEFVARLDSLVDAMRPSVLFGERARALGDAAQVVRDPDAKATLERLARENAARAGAHA